MLCCAVLCCAVLCCAVLRSVLCSKLASVHLKEWAKQLKAVLKHMKMLVRLDAWLAHTGPRMQVRECNGQAGLHPNYVLPSWAFLLCCHMNRHGWS
jgi:hypothetical protein